MEIIEPATVDDVPELASLLGVLFTQEADFTPDQHRQEAGLRLIIASPEIGLVLVARKPSGISGMVSLLFTVSTAEGARVAWLEDMVVREELRGGGLGSRLLQAAVDHARHQGLRRISLLTDKVNAPAQRLYARRGFRESEMMVMRLTLPG